MKANGPTLLILLLAITSAAHAQVEPLPERLYLGSGVLLGSARVVALGGAYTPIAEGASSFTSNLAAIAHRAPDLDRPWDIGVAFSWLDVPVTNPTPRDLDNDGEQDKAQQSTQYLVGLMLQFQRFGVGTYLRGSAQSYCASATSCAPEDYLGVRVQHAALAGAVALGRDDLIIGFGVYAAEVDFEHHGETWKYEGNGLELDALFRPVGRKWRLGLSLKPEVVGRYRPGASQVPLIAGRPAHAAVVSPATISFGGALRLGDGAENFNRLSPAARTEFAAKWGEAALPPDASGGERDGTWLVSTQLDLVAPTRDAVALTAFTSMNRETQAEHVGRSLLLVPRVGVEHETLPGRLRTRAGAFLEASPFAQTRPRPHLTGGAELFLFRYYDDWATTVSFDVARRYGYFGLSFGVWR